jgi:hypothetical protein
MGKRHDNRQTLMGLQARGQVGRHPDFRGAHRSGRLHNQLRRYIGRGKNTKCQLICMFYLRRKYFGERRTVKGRANHAHLRAEAAGNGQVAQGQRRGHVLQQSLDLPE